MTLTHIYIVFNLLHGTTNGIKHLGTTLSSTNFKEEIIICQHLDSTSQVPRPSCEVPSEFQVSWGT